MHKVMECVDFKDALARTRNGEGEIYVRRQVEQLVEREILLPEEARAVDCDRIAAFFESPLGQRAGRAKRVHKETEFNLLWDMDGTQVMVQGVIDCYFEEAGKLILIDYKNSYVDPENRQQVIVRLKDAYQGQIDIYRQALETIREKPVAEAYLYLFSENDYISYHTNHNQ